MADKAAQIPVLHLYHNRDAKIYMGHIRDDMVYMENEKVARFSPSAIFTVKTPKKLPKRFKLVICLDGKAEACNIQKGSDMKTKIQAENNIEETAAGLPLNSTINLGKLQEIPDSIETLIEPLTYRDRITVVKREVAKQLGKFKPMETWQFGVIIGLLIAAIVVGAIF